MKVAIIYHSKTGHTKEMAEAISKGITSVEDFECRTFPIEDIDKDYVKECNGVIVGTPTYHASLSGQMKVWLEKVPAQCSVAGKLTGAFATATYVHGGADIAVQSVLSHLLVAGAMVYSSGCAFGAPVIHLGPVAIDNDLASYHELFKIYGKRFAEQMKQLF